MKFTCRIMELYFFLLTVGTYGVSGFFFPGAIYKFIPSLVEWLGMGGAAENGGSWRVLQSDGLK